MGKKRQSQTVLVCYSDTPLNDRGRGMKKYAFNTSSKVKVGDRINSPSYNTPMEVVRVLGTKYRYYCTTTGKLSHRLTHTQMWEIRDLKISNATEAICATRIN